MPHDVPLDTPLDAPDPHALLGQVALAAERFVATVAALEDDELRAPSALDGWTRGHVVAHVARSADAYVGLLLTARDGVAPGPRLSAAELARAVEADAGRGRDGLAGQVRSSLDRFVREARALPVEAWQRMVCALAGWRHPAWFTLHRCRRELETHHVDLRLAYGTHDWPAAYVSWALEETVATLRAQDFPVTSVHATDLGRTWRVGSGGPSVAAPGHALLGWLAGRLPAPAPEDEAARTDLARAPGDLPLPHPPVWPRPPYPGWGRCE
ncbi:maleylpyruvate isomerase family mycothiol-dependent enzyme [Streptomyces griseosporeus]|uniref:maleylpyruvate isomerase family mycothiol-dependent enzyme n=1 Tax=Streptomyces griseosporeus TaxID=1910 RepID=UPI00167DEB76|nr:maleylpyruvate isomerase family mycothiol-dependent enzyme [Streptomyces griseosporeus]GHF56181.1 maleylpyruvate isomerase [Streptomyces griseosporeus]